MLAEFNKKHKLGLSIGRGFTGRNYLTFWIRIAVKRYCIDAYRTVLSCIEHDNSVELLHLAYTHGQAKLLRGLTEEGGYVQVKVDGEKGMEIAAKYKYQDVVEVLLDAVNKDRLSPRANGDLNA
jgi:hypothetical protein